VSTESKEDRRRRFAAIMAQRIADSFPPEADPEALARELEAIDPALLDPEQRSFFEQFCGVVEGALAALHEHDQTDIDSAAFLPRQLRGKYPLNDEATKLRKAFEAHHDFSVADEATLKQLAPIFDGVAAAGCRLAFSRLDGASVVVISDSGGAPLFKESSPTVLGLLTKIVEHTAELARESAN
jgi:hypothetical protein